MLVTVQGPEQRVELQLPADRPIAALLPLLVQVCAGAEPMSEAEQWELAPLGGLAFDRARTLDEAGVIDGSLLHLRNSAAAPVLNYLTEQPAEGPVDPRELDTMVAAGWEEGFLPQERTRLVLPAKVGLGRRLASASQAALAFGGRANAPAVQPELGHIVDPTSIMVRSRPRLTERVRASWRATDYVQRLEEFIVTPQLRRCVTIAVMSPKGGVGKTTITTLLGSLFALLRRDRVVAIDTNPDFGSLGRQLTPEHTIFLDDLLEVLDAPELTVTALDNHLGRTAHGLMVLPAPTDPRRAGMLDAAAYTRVVRKLQQMVGVIVLDTGTGFHEAAARAAMSTADQIVLVSDTEPATASLVAEAAAMLAPDRRATWLVVNKAGVQTELDLRAFGAVVPHARGLVEVGNDVRAARQVAAGRLMWVDAPTHWRTSLRELAAALVADWRELGIST